MAMVLSKWIPEPSQRKTAAMAKLTEECGELIAILGRSTAQGIAGIDPDTGKPNIEAIAEEIADVRALINVVTALLALDQRAIMERDIRKTAAKLEWLMQVPE